MPDAEDATTFWQNIIDSRVSIRDLPEAAGPALSINSGQKARGLLNKPHVRQNRCLCRRLRGRRRWRQLPVDLHKSVSIVGGRGRGFGLEHAGYGDEGRPLDRSRVGVVFANAPAVRTATNPISGFGPNATVRYDGAGSPASSSDAFVDAIVEGAPKNGGHHRRAANVVLGRVANLLDLQGPNHASTQRASCWRPCRTLAAASRAPSTR